MAPEWGEIWRSQGTTAMLPMQVSTLTRFTWLERLSKFVIQLLQNIEHVRQFLQLGDSQRSYQTGQVPVLIIYCPRALDVQPQSRAIGRSNASRRSGSKTHRRGVPR